LAALASSTAAAMTELRKIAESAADLDLDLDLDPSNPIPTETAMTTKTEHAWLMNMAT
jgi:hypothetical protein